MKSPTSFFKSSLIRSDIKRFSWAAILQTIAMYLVFVMPIATQNPSYYSDGTRSLTLGFGQAANLTLCIYAVAIAALVFSYMHAPAGCTMLHGLPFSRTMLFVSNAFAGLVLLLVPSLVNTLALLVVKYTMDIGRFVLISEIASWLWSNVTLGIVIYALAVFVGMFARPYRRACNLYLYHPLSARRALRHGKQHLYNCTVRLSHARHAVVPDEIPHVSV